MTCRHHNIVVAAAKCHLHTVMSVALQYSGGSVNLVAGQSSPSAASRIRAFVVVSTADFSQYLSVLVKDFRINKTSRYQSRRHRASVNSPSVANFLSSLLLLLSARYLRAVINSCCK
jgi:hypothetical protein